MENEFCLAKESEPPSETLEPPSQGLEPPGGTVLEEAYPWGHAALSSPAPHQPSLFPFPVIQPTVQHARGPASFKTSPRSKQFRLRFFPKAPSG